MPENHASAAIDTNPLMVEITRGGIVESRHRGAAAVVAANGAVQASWGDIGKAIYPRSSIKAFQALPGVETDAFAAAGFTGQEIALACSSHNGEKEHATTAAAMLSKLGLDESDLECGAHWPYHEESARAMAVAGEAPTQLHNNCSGKHSGMLALAKHLGAPTRGYIKPDHPVQQRILGAIEFMCGADMGSAPWSPDGCSAPTWALPLENLAYGFARFGAPDDLPEDRAKACRTILDAGTSHPFYIAGSERFCTEVMQVLGRRAFVKTGAEGVFCAALPDYGLGVAVKCDDGAGRGAEMMMISILRHVGVVEDADLEKLAKWIETPVKNRRAIQTGTIRPADGWLAF